MSGTAADQQEQIGTQKRVVLKTGYLQEGLQLPTIALLKKKKIWNSSSLLIRQWIDFQSAFHKNGKVNDTVTKTFLESYFGKGMKSSYHMMPSSGGTISSRKLSFEK